MSAINEYYRGDEDWAPLTQTFHETEMLIMSPGTYTFHIRRAREMTGGSEIRSIQIAATSSQIKISNNRYTGGGGTGADPSSPSPTPPQRSGRLGSRCG